jgi:hypothetical protein
MFIPAGELRGYNLNPYDVEHERTQEHEQWDYSGREGPMPDVSHNDVWEIKGEEADSRGLWHDIQDEGVKKPVSIYHGQISAFGDRGRVEDPSKPTIANGGHRVAAAAETDSDQLVPVKHYATEHHSFVRAVQGGNPEQYYRDGRTH